MADYFSDGKKLIGIEYDDIPTINDTIDGMRVLSSDKRAEDENAMFLLEPNGNISCFVFDEIFIVGRVSGFENLVDAIEAWKNQEI
ncbi:hypothetical protein M947_06695 [Sulfurimonas hongkongensis]|uniref:Uncharacterized protein n=1 Tax=Sulfurimonas hongkongensis TaxID=1172190 RepID=T0L1N6_9BACT|nr:hypothetical protein [Sulfurimonas hongkongensis]EQB39678.1 hypothetical protein M947_06695 [Sulfurimonas hongkongensis]